MRIILITVITLCIGFGSTPVPASEMTIDQAYQALGHKRTQFKKNSANMSKAESEYLDHMFFVTDLVFRERMLMLRYFNAGRSGDYIEAYNTQINDLLQSFELIKAPNKHLMKVEKILLSAIKDQQAFFNEWHKAKGTPHYTALSQRYSSHRLVQSSHKKLLQAYGVLKAQYGRETAHNQKAFYDHLCALDFI